MAKFFLFINGDANSPIRRRHHANLERALQNVFEAKRDEYETYVIDPERPTAPCDHYATPTLQNIQGLIEELKKKITPQDELVIYTTGHGKRDQERGTLCLPSGCDYQKLASLLDGIPFGTRRVMMDQCYGGNWNSLFLDDPKTLFVTAGSKDERACCQEMAPLFFEKAENIPDLNQDNIISWQERYAYAAAGVQRSEPQFVPSPGYVEEGEPPFAKKVIPVLDESGMKSQLSKLQPGQYAVITFSAVWCKACQHFRPRFDQMAQEGRGQHLWVWTDNEELAKQWNVLAYPTVMIVDSKGRRRAVENWEQIPQELAQFEVPLQERLLARLEGKLASAKKIEGTYDRFWVLANIAFGLMEAGRREKGEAVIEEAVTTSQEVSIEYRSEALEGLAYRLGRAGLSEKASEVFNKAVEAAGEIHDENYRSYALRSIASKLVDSDLKEKRLDIFETLIAMAEKMSVPYYRSYALQGIALQLIHADWKEKAKETFDRAIAATAGIHDAGDRAWSYADIAYTLVQAGWRERGLEFFEKAAVQARKVGSPYYRLKALQNIQAKLVETGLR